MKLYYVTCINYDDDYDIDEETIQSFDSLHEAAEYMNTQLGYWDSVVTTLEIVH